MDEINNIKVLRLHDKTQAFPVENNLKLVSFKTVINQPKSRRSSANERILHFVMACVFYSLIIKSYIIKSIKLLFVYSRITNLVKN